MPRHPNDLPWYAAVAAVIIGGGLGSLLRWAADEATKLLDASRGCTDFCHLVLGSGGVSADTWLLNLISVFILAFLTARLVASPNRRGSQMLKLLVGTGFCGGLGTYGGPVWQVVSYGEFHLLYLGELLVMFVVALPVGLVAMWFGTRRARVANALSEDTTKDSTGGQEQ